VIGNDTAITMAGASGNFELNVMLPVMARNILESARLLATTSRLLADRCVDGIEADVDRARELAEGSPSIVTPLNRYIGYEAAAAVAKQSIKERRPIRDVVLERGHVERGELTEAQLDAALAVLAMTRPPRCREVPPDATTRHTACLGGNPPKWTEPCAGRAQVSVHLGGLPAGALNLSTSAVSGSARRSRRRRACRRSCGCTSAPT
jgi:hypothetical protein